MEGSLVAYKVFTNGSVLNASEMNEYLMNQSVITFSNSTARGSAITTPVEGMITYLEDTQTYESWDGAAWINLVSSSSGIDFITAQDFTGVTSVSLGSDASPIFNSTYDVYKIVISPAFSTDADRTVALRLRADTTDFTGSSYRFYNQGMDRTGASVNTFGTSTSMTLISNSHYTGSNPPIEIDLYYPFLSEQKYLHGMSSGVTASNSLGQRVGGVIINSSSYNGFTLLNSSGNFIDSRVSVYGYRRA
jgi:hypothetical protein